MTKLDELNVFLSERLSAAVNEILDTVSRMMQEYEEEAARIRKDNDYLKEMIKLTGWSFIEINPGLSLGKQDGMSNLQHESETWEGWCQNPELKQESTSIKIEQPDPLYPTHLDSDCTNAFPISDVEMGSPISNVWTGLKRSKGKAKLKLKKKHYCVYCKKPSLRMTQHLLSAHGKEPEVAKALSYDKKSKERKQLLDLLQSKGNLLHKDVGMSKTLASSKQHAKARSNTDSVQCVYCLGLYSSKSIANHVKRCKHKYPYKAEASTASPTFSNVASQPSTSLIKLNQESSPNSIRSCKDKQENPHSLSGSSHVSDTGHSAAQLYIDPESAGSPCEDLGLVGEQLFADLNSQSDLTPDTSLARNNHTDKKTTCTSLAYNQTETSMNEDKKTATVQSSQNLHTEENRKKSLHVETQSRTIDNPLDEEENVLQNSLLHICQHCSATFCSPYHLRRHEYTHTNERPYWCSECDVGFIQKYRYRNHRMTHHGERHLSVNKDESRRCKKRSSGGEEPAESELH
ncbi:zinc finger protein 354A isoform X1 [Silurus meridionalis]|uniref:zinc finger protein 354A isoform X1 n=2 Tax=Silurus meridionalis TaxID=175797 RepID=UPI001EECEF2F|nr:zinc finger protein 354A isoform X1 [Silurus meridionalis]